VVLDKQHLLINVLTALLKPVFERKWLRIDAP